MPFWTLFWLIVPPIVLLATGIIFFVLTGKEKKWTRS
jgi:hypothetical protein